MAKRFFSCSETGDAFSPLRRNLFFAALAVILASCAAGAEFASQASKNNSWAQYDWDKQFLSDPYRLGSIEGNRGKAVGAARKNTNFFFKNCSKAKKNTVNGKRSTGCGVYADSLQPFMAVGLYSNTYQETVAQMLGADAMVREPDVTRFYTARNGRDGFERISRWRMFFAGEKYVVDLWAREYMTNVFGNRQMHIRLRALDDDRLITDIMADLRARDRSDLSAEELAGFSSYIEQRRSIISSSVAIAELQARQNYEIYRNRIGLDRALRRVAERRRAFGALLGGAVMSGALASQGASASVALKGGAAMAADISSGGTSNSMQFQSSLRADGAGGVASDYEVDRSAVGALVKSSVMPLRCSSGRQSSSPPFPYVRETCFKAATEYFSMFACEEYDSRKKLEDVCLAECGRIDCMDTRIDEFACVKDEAGVCVNN